MAVRRKTVVRWTDAILRGDLPEPELSLTDAGWLARRNGDLVPGPEFGDVVGLAINRESITWTVAGLREPVASGRIDASVLPVRRSDAPAEDAMAGHLARVLSDIAPELPHGRIGGIGVSWPGPIAPTGEPRDYPHHHSGLRDAGSPTLGLTEMIRAALVATGLAEGDPGRPLEGEFPEIATIKDADAEMLYELRYGVAKGIRNAVGLKICGGIGMSIVQDAHFVRGGRGSAGEIQHIQVHLEKGDSLPQWPELVPLGQLDPCSCGANDHVGTFATGMAIIDQMSEYFPDDSKLTPNQRGHRIQGQEANPIVHDVCERAGRLIGNALVGPVLALDPELVVVSSFPRSDSLVAGVRSRLKRSHSYLRREEIVAGTPSTPERDTASIGAARLVVERVLVPSIDRTVPKGSNEVHPVRLSAFLRQRLPHDLDDAADYNPSYGRLPLRVT